MQDFMPGMVSKLSGTTKNLTAGLMSDPQKIENIISMVRTVAPLTSEHTVSTVNTYLPLFEKVSTLLGMYSFLNRAQTFRPIQTLNAKSPVDMVTSLMKNGNLPVGKMLAQPLIANNMEKMMGTMAMNMFKNGSMDELLKNVNINDIMKNGNISDMLSSFTKNSGSSQDNNGNNGNNGNIDLNSLMETFMPIINSMSASNSNNDNNYETPQKNTEFKNEHYLPDEESDSQDTYDDSYEKYEKYNDYNKYDKPKNDHYDRNYKNDKYDSYETPVNYNDHKNQKPIRIKQRKRR